MELTNRGVLITGAGRGLGKVLALSLAYCGCRLGLVSRTEKELNEVARSIQGKKGSAVALPADITDSAAVQKMVARAEGELGNIDVLIHCAGVGRYNPLEMLTVGEIDEMIDTNLKGTIYVTQAVYQRMRMKAAGTIIHVLSTAAREGKPRETAYCASKWGVMGFSRALAMEARRYGIRVMAICPGGMETSFWDATPADQRPPAKRLMSPEIAALAIRQVLELPENIEVPEYAIRPCV